MTYVNTMKSQIFFFMAFEKWVHAFLNTFSWDVYEKEIHIVVTKRFKEKASSYEEIVKQPSS